MSCGEPDPRQPQWCWTWNALQAPCRMQLSTGNLTLQTEVKAQWPGMNRPMISTRGPIFFMYCGVITKSNSPLACMRVSGTNLLKPKGWLLKAAAVQSSPDSIVYIPKGSAATFYRASEARPTRASRCDKVARLLIVSWAIETTGVMSCRPEIHFWKVRNPCSCFP